ncbi:ShlB/FhaC/HecB family hemolysin secretion/activation protein [Paucimonas lemoignei]|uniref:ShlB/FhaC/HecB family hemolysin secretion/activation protein n=1 Tax=Paucimonas lemoignei TaxID=29443 RepID=UPI001FB37D46|nr:ShlB/FhaC/HecB family hemolysin secretion/activation protein [Paucimonas lemoignei]
MAQTVPLSPAQVTEEGLRRQEERTREQQQQIQPKADVLQPQAPIIVPTRLPVEQPCFVIQGVELIGPDAVRFGWLADSASPYLGQCVGVAGLRHIAAALDAKLIELGYVTSRVTLPQQNLNDGILTMQLHVGRVAQITMRKAEKDKPQDDGWGTWRNAFPVAEGDVLNVRDLEQGVEQMKRLPSQNVATELEPGANPDTSNVVILRQSGTVWEHVRGGVTIDNSGSRTLGLTQLSGYLSLDNLLGLNDIISISANTNAENLAANHRSQSASFNYSIPWGYNTFSYSKSYSRFAQTVAGTTVQFLSSGTGVNDEIKWHRTVVRTSATKAGFYTALATRRANSFLDDVELVVQRRRTSSVETGITYKQLIGDASLDFELGYRHGVNWRDAQDDLPSSSSGGLTLRPDITILTGSFSKPFKIGSTPLQYSASIRAQYTPDQTLSVDQIAIGNRFTVRGFDGDNVLLAESGYFIRNDLSIPVKLMDNLVAVAYLGLDFGRVWGPSTALLVGDKLAGTAVGLRGQWQQLQFDLSLGAPIYKPVGFRTRSWSPYLSLTYAF